MFTPSAAYMLLLGGTIAVPGESDSLIDPATPASAQSVNSYRYDVKHDLVFSDEFETEGRSFVEGTDKKWTAANTNNFATADLEAYVPRAASTTGGAMKVAATLEIQLDPSGTPRPFTSAMVQSWNQFCFTGGIVEMSVKLPGGTKSGIWAAAWLSGNLGRVGFGPNEGVLSNAGLWPWSYDHCDEISAGMKYDGCDSETPAYCKAQNLSDADCALLKHNKKLLGKHARGQTEIDVFELFTDINWQTVGTTQAGLSLSLQTGPNTNGAAWSAWQWRDPCYEQVSKNLYPIQPAALNKYHGDTGRDSISALLPLEEDDYSDGLRLRVEWEPGQYLKWLYQRPEDTEWTLAFAVTQEALAECGSTKSRDIPKEPMYFIFNNALSHQGNAVDFNDKDFWKGFPYEMSFEYVRVYQEAGKTSTSCSPEDYPTAAFIDANPSAFHLPDPATTTVSCGSESPCVNATISANHSEGIYSFHDTRCPVFGSIFPGGCLPPYENMCRACRTKSSFIKHAFKEGGVFGVATDSGAVATPPICPPCVCEAAGLDASECAEQTLPDASASCLSLKLSSPVMGDMTVPYCSNAYGNQSSSSSNGLDLEKNQHLDEVIVI